MFTFLVCDSEHSKETEFGRLLGSLPVESFLYLLVPTCGLCHGGREREGGRERGGDGGRGREEEEERDREVGREGGDGEREGGRGILCAYYYWSSATPT